MTYLRARRSSPAREIIAVINGFPEREPWRANTHLNAVHQHLGQRAPELGFAIEHFWLGEHGMTPARLSRIMRTRGIVGAVLLAFPRCTTALEIDWAQFACTAIGHSLAVPLHRVCSNQYRDLNTALKSLAALGYLRPGLVLNPDVNLRVEHHYVAAYLAAQWHRPACDRMDPLLFTGGREQFLRWFEQQQPDALLLSQPPPAREVIQAWLAAEGRAIPRDVGLALLDLPHDASKASGIRQPYGANGSAAVEFVAGQITRGERGIPPLPQMIYLEGQWLTGETTTPQRLVAARSR